MIRVMQVVLGLRIFENWYEYKDSSALSLNVYLHVKNKKKPQLHFKRIAYTIENSLEESPEEIFNRFSTSIKYQVKRAKKEGVLCSVENDLKKFVEFYNLFALSKGLPKTSFRRLQQLSSNLLITKATINDQTLAAHSYFLDYDLGIVRSFQSPTGRLDEINNPAEIARANKLLYYEDMMFFKEKGVKTFDFGGYYLDSENQGINEFKLSFGGQKVTCINYYTIPSLFLRKTASMIKDFKNSLRKIHF